VETPALFLVFYNQAKELIMKIKIISSCVGMDGEHLEAGSTVDYPDDTAKKLVNLGRATAHDGAAKPAAKPAAAQEKDDDVEDGLEEDPDLGEESKAPAKNGKKGK